MNPVSGALNINSANVYNNHGINVYGSNTLTFGSSSIVANSGGLSVLGGGTVVYQSAHTYTGQTFVNNGTLRFDSGGSANSSTLNILDTSGSSSGTITLNANSLSLSSNINVRSGSSGTATILSQGTGQTLSGSVTLNKNAAVNVSSGNGLTISGLLNTNGNTLDKLGAGNLTLSNGSNNAANRYYLGAGTLNVSGEGNLGNRGGIGFGNKLYFDGGILNATASFTIQGNNGITFAGSGGRISVASGQTLTIQSFIDDANVANDFIKSGTGTLFLDKTDTNDFSHTTIRVYEGTLSTWNPGGLLSSTVQLGDTATSGTYQFTKSDGAVTADKTFSIAAGGGSINVTNDALSLGTGNLTGSGTFTKLGAGTLTLAGASNSHSGSVVVSSGTLAVNSNLSSTAFTLSGGNLTTNAANRLADTASLTVNTGTLTLGGADTVGAISGSGGQITINGAYALTTSTSSSSTYSGVIAGASGQLTKAGTGALTLSGANTYGGGTTIQSSGGTININHATAIGSGALTIGGGSTTIDNTSAGAITLSNNNNISLSGGPLTFTGSNSLSFGTGVLTISGANRDITVNGNTLTVGSINASGTNPTTRSIDKLGAGTLVVSGSAGADFQAGATISAGTLTIGHQSALGTGAITIGSGTLTAASGFTVANNIILGTASSGSATIAGANNLEFSGSITNSGASRTLLINKTGSTTLSGSIFLSEATGTGRALTLNTATDVTASGVISNFSGGAGTAGNLIKQGAGTLILTNANTYTGTTTISAGILQIGNAGTTGALSSSSTITNNAGLVFNQTDTVTQGTDFANNIGGSGTLTQNGSGTLALNTSNSYTGATTINAGALRASNNTALGTTAGGVTVASGAALELTGGITVGAEALNLSGSGISSGGALRNISGDNTYGGAITLAAASRINSDSGLLTLDVASGSGITGTFNLTFGGAGNITVADVIATSTGTLAKDGAGTLTLSGANSYTGATTVSGGTLTLSGGSAISDSGAVSLANTAGVQLNVNSSETIASLQGGGTTGGNVSIAASQTLTVAEGGTNSFGGIISGSGGLTKTGAGTLTLSGANSYTGTTTISAGALALGATDAIGNSSAVVIGGGTLAMGSNNDTVASLTMTSGSLSGTGTLTATTYALQGGSIGANLGAGTATVTTGTTTLSGTLGAATVNINSGNLTLGAADRLADGATVTVGGGILDSGANADTVSALNMSSGSILGSGTLTASTYALSGGTVGGALGAGTASITNTVSLTGTMASTTINILNTGNLSLGSAARIADATNVDIASGGVLTLNNNNETVAAISGAGNIALGSATLTSNFAGSSTLSGVISGATGALTKQGAGTLILSGNNTYTGATTISAGTLQLGAGGNSGNVTSDITNNSALVIDRSNNFTYGNAISGTGSLTKNGSGALTLSGINTFSGTTTINNGSIRLGGAASSDTLTGNIVVNTGGTLDYSTNNDNQINNSAFVTVAGGTFDAGSRGETIAGLTITSGNFTKAGGTFSLGGNLSMSGGNLSITSSGTLALGAASSITSGTVSLSNAGARINTTGTTTLGTSTFSYNSASAATQGIVLSGDFLVNNSSTVDFTNAAAGAGRITLGGAARVFDVGSSGNMNVGWVIDATNSSGTLTKNGTGTLTLSAANTYSGTTTLNNGRININNNSALGTGGFTINGGSIDATTAGITIGNTQNWNGDFTFAGTNDLNLGTGAVAMNATRTVTVTANNLTAGGVISGAGFGLTKAGAGTLTLSGANTYTGNTTVNLGTLAIGAADRISNSSNLTVTGGSFNLGSFNEQVNQVTITGGTIDGSGTLTGSSYALQGGTVNANLGAGTITVSSGTATLNGTSASTTVNISSGTLALASAGALASTATISVSSGATLDLTAKSSGFSLGNGATLNGVGTVTTAGGQSLSIGTGATIAPATSSTSGTLTVGGLTFASGGTYAFTMGNVAGTPGTEWDLLSVTNNFDITATSGSKFTITIGGNSGNPTGFSNGGTYSWNILTLGSGSISGFSEDKFTLTNNLSGITGTFSLSATSSALTLNYAAGASGILWSSAGGSAWLTAANWTGSTVPGALDIAQFGVNPTSPTTGVGINMGGSTNNGSNNQIVGAIELTSARTNNLVIGNSGSVAGTLTLNGAQSGGVSNVVLKNSGSGNLTIQNTQSGSVGSSTMAVALAQNENVVVIDSTGGITVSSAITGSGKNLTLQGSGSGVFTLAGNNTYTGNTTITSRTLAVSSTGRLGGGSYSGNISNSGAFIFGSDSDQTLSGIHSGSGTLTKNGSGTLTLSGANTNTGAITVNTGALRASNSAALGTTAGGVTVASGAALELTGGISIGAEALSLTGSGSSSTGALRNISGTNSYAGAITLAGATTIGSDAGTLTLTGGLSGTNTNLTIVGAGATTVSTNGLSIGSGTLTKNGSGTLTLSASNTYSGATTINDGTINANASGALGTSSSITVNGGSLLVTRLSLLGGVTGRRG